MKNKQREFILYTVVLCYDLMKRDGKNRDGGIFLLENVSFLIGQSKKKNVTFLMEQMEYCFLCNT